MKSETEKPPRPLLHASLSEMRDLLIAHRRWLVGAYLAVMAAWFGLFLFHESALLLPELLYGDWWGDERDLFRPEDGNDSSVFMRLAIMAIFCGLQALFIWGGGRVRLAAQPTKFPKRIVALIFFSVLMAALTGGLLFTFLQLTDRSLEALSEKATRAFSIGEVFLVLTLAAWALWLGVGLLLVRKTDHGTGLSRLIAGVLAGSWIEFTVAIPVEMVTRDRSRECPCASGSWLTLLFCMPLLLWSIGPALYLFYLRERTLSPNGRHARRVLLAKSERPAPPPTSEEAP